MNNSIIRFLHYVFAACEHGSFHRAARSLGIETSAISRRIHDIEARLGFDLFRRDHDGVQLTTQGLSWVSDIRPHYDALQEKTQSALSSAKYNNILQIGVGTSLGKVEIVNLLLGQNKDKVQISAALTDGPCSLHRSRVSSRQIDIAFVWECCSCEGYRRETLWRDRLFICMPENHHLAARQKLHWAELRKERLLIPQGKNGPLFDPCLLKRVRDSGACPQIDFCDAAQVTVLTEVMLGSGISVAGHALASSQLPGVVWRPLDGDNSSLSVNAIWLESNVKPLLHRLLGRVRESLSFQIETSVKFRKL